MRRSMPGRAADDYLPVLLMFLFGILFAAGSLGISHLVGERGRKVRAKDTPYECGVPVQTHAHERFSVKFYLLAILFIVFDVEVVFLYPWASAWATPGNTGSGAPTTALLAWELAVFVAILLAGWWYVVKKGVLEWTREE
jgi:NADH-quinone oxidoreductase subunit A